MTSTSISEPVAVNDLRHEEVVASLREVVGVPEEELAGVSAGFRRVLVARQRHLKHPRAAAPPVRHVESWNTDTATQVKSGLVFDQRARDLGLDLCACARTTEEVTVTHRRRPGAGSCRAAACRGRCT